MMSSLLRDSFLVTKLFRLSVHFVRYLPLFLLYSIFACLVHQLSLYAQKLKLSFSWLFWVGIFCIRSFPLLLRFCSFQSMIFSFFFWYRPYHISVVCKHCKTLPVKERYTDQSEVYSFEKNNMIPQPTVAYLHQQIPLEKSSKQLSILSEKMHHLWLFQQHCVSSLSRRWSMLQKKNQTITWFAWRKVLSCIYRALNLYANIRLHHNIKGLNISAAAASQRKAANRKVSTLRHL